MSGPKIFAAFPNGSAQRHWFKIFMLLGLYWPQVTMAHEKTSIYFLTYGGENKFCKELSNVLRKASRGSDIVGNLDESLPTLWRIKQETKQVFIKNGGDFLVSTSVVPIYNDGVERMIMSRQYISYLSKGWITRIFYVMKEISDENKYNGYLDFDKRIDLELNFDRQPYNLAQMHTVYFLRQSGSVKRAIRENGIAPLEFKSRLPYLSTESRQYVVRYDAKYYIIVQDMLAAYLQDGKWPAGIKVDRASHYTVALELKSASEIDDVCYFAISANSDR